MRPPTTDTPPRDPRLLTEGRGFCLPQVPRCSIPLVGSRRTRPCEDCGRPVERQVNSRRRWLCIGCAEKAVERNCRSVAMKTGPGYRRWKAGQLVYLQRLMRGQDYPAIQLPPTPVKREDSEAS